VISIKIKFAWLSIIAAYGEIIQKRAYGELIYQCRSNIATKFGLIKYIKVL